MITTVILLFLILVGNLYLITQLTVYFEFEYIVILLGVIATVVLFYSQYNSKRWSWAFSSIVHSLALGNLGLLFVWTNNYFVALLTMFIVLIGLLRSFAKIDEQEWEDQMQKDDIDMETYDSPRESSTEPIQADAVIAPEKRTTKTGKKSTKKRAAKKTTKRKKKRTTRKRR